MILDVIFSGFLVLVFAYSMYEVWDIPRLAHVFPFWISLVALVLSLIQLGTSVRRRFVAAPGRTRSFADQPANRDAELWTVYRRALYYAVWLLGLYAAIWMVGFVIAMTLFILTFLRWEARTGWASATAMSLCSAAFLVVISWLMTLYWPEGQLGRVLELPWPFK